MSKLPNQTWYELLREVFGVDEEALQEDHRKGDCQVTGIEGTRISLLTADEKSLGDNIRGSITVELHDFNFRHLRIVGENSGPRR